MNREQWLLAAAMFAAIGTMGAANADTWADILKPSFVLPALGAMAVQIRSVFTERP